MTLAPSTDSGDSAAGSSGLAAGDSAAGSGDPTAVGDSAAGGSGSGALSDAVVGSAAGGSGSGGSSSDARAAAVPARPPRPPLSGYALFAALLGVSILGAVGIAALLLSVTGSAPATVFRTMVEGSLGSRVALVATLNHMGPILAVALGAVIAVRSGLLNIGQEGQIAIGAMAGAAVGLAVVAPRPIALAMILASAAVAGGLWAGVAAGLRFGRGVSEVITTLLLNFVAFQVVSFAVNRSWLLQETLPEGSVLSASPQSDPLPAAGRLPTLISGPGFRLHSGILVALAGALVVAFLLARTRWGFNLRMVGLNQRTAKRAGVSPVAVGAGALMASGAFAGLAGGILLTGTAFRVNDGFSSNYGWEGLLVALIAGARASLAVPAAFLYGALRAGGGVLASTGVSPRIVGVVQALILLAVALPSLYMQHRQRRALAEQTAVART